MTEITGQMLHAWYLAVRKNKKAFAGPWEEEREEVRANYDAVAQCVNEYIAAQRQEQQLSLWGPGTSPTSDAPEGK